MHVRSGCVHVSALSSEVCSWTSHAGIGGVFCRHLFLYMALNFCTGEKWAYATFALYTLMASHNICPSFFWYAFADPHVCTGQCFRSCGLPDSHQLLSHLRCSLLAAGMTSTAGTGSTSRRGWQNDWTCPQPWQPRRGRCASRCRPGTTQCTTRTARPPTARAPCGVLVGRTASPPRLPGPTSAALGSSCST